MPATSRIAIVRITPFAASHVKKLRGPMKARNHSMRLPETKMRSREVKSGLATIQGCALMTPAVPASTVNEVHTNISPEVGSVCKESVC